MVIREERFRQWLESVTPRTIVGSWEHPFRHPLAEFIRFLVPEYHTVRVSNVDRVVHVYVDDDVIVFDPPLWAKDFISELKTASYRRNFEVRNIQARTCLKILNRSGPFSEFIIGESR